MTANYGNQEHQGWCAHCRVIWTWRGLVPTQQDAACPNAGCGLPLGRKPRGMRIGRYAIRNCTPIARSKPRLVLTEIDDTQPQKDIA